MATVKMWRKEWGHRRISHHLGVYLGEGPGWSRMEAVLANFPLLRKKGRHCVRVNAGDTGKRWGGGEWKPGLRQA